MIYVGVCTEYGVRLTWMPISLENGDINWAPSPSVLNHSYQQFQS